MQDKKKICIAFLGNAHHDSRVVNLSESLRKDNCDVTVISFDWITPNFQSYKDDTTTIYKLNKSKISLFFYLHFAYKLTVRLLSAKADIFFAEDVYSLPFVKLAAWLKNSKVYYNSRELYAFIGGLRNKKFVQKLITAIESFFIKRVDLVLATGEMDSQFLEKFYGINNTLVIRNIPKFQKPSQLINLRKRFNIKDGQIIFLYQGVLIDGRGIELFIRNLKKIDKGVLVLVGDGEKKKYFINLAEEEGVKERVFFTGTIPQKELINYTAAADIGLCLIENISVSYYHALPNKLFEYIMAGLPVISSSLPQMKKIVEKHGVGICIDIEKQKDISKQINEMIIEKNKLDIYKDHSKEASKILNWENEYDNVKSKLLKD